MDIDVLFEDRRGRDYTIGVARGAKDRNKIEKLTGGKNWEGKKYKPNVNYITLAARVDDKIVGFITVRNLTKTARVQRLMVNKDYEDHPKLKKDLLKKAKKKVSNLEYDSISASADEGSSKAFTEVLGEPVAQRELKKGVQNNYMHSFSQRPTERVATRSGPLYKS